MDTPRLVPVRFVTAQSPFNAGEVAGFPANIAERFIRFGVAELAEPPADGEGSTPPPAADVRTHDLTIDGVGELAETITDPAEIAKLIEGERAHPKHQGGRKGALEFLELRAAELAEPPA